MLERRHLTRIVGRDLQLLKLILKFTHVEHSLRQNKVVPARAGDWQEIERKNPGKKRASVIALSLLSTEHTTFL